MMLQDEPDELTETIFRTMILGVENVALQYPGVVRITKVGGE
jgi:uncharacterized protein YsxB (DUF464 family)